MLKLREKNYFKNQSIYESPIFLSFFEELIDPLLVSSCMCVNRLCEKWECDPVTPYRNQQTCSGNSLQILLFLFENNWNIIPLKQH